jgi:serine protease Do
VRVQSGDVIVKFDGSDIREMRDLPRVVADTSVGKSVEIVVVRKGKEEKLRITLGRLEDSEKPQPASAKSPAPEPRTATKRLLGLELSTLSDDMRKKFKVKDNVKGVLIVSIEGNSPLADQRVRPGDVIVEVTGEAVASPEHFQRRVDALKKDGKKSALILLSNGEGEQRFVPVTIP